PGNWVRFQQRDTVVGSSAGRGHTEVDAMLDALRRSSVKFRDSLRYSPLNMESLALLRAIKGRALGGARGRAELLRAYRLAERRPLLDDLRERLGPFLDERSSDPRAELSQAGGDYAAVLSRPALDRTIVLKAPGAGGEKGVLLVMLEPNWLKLIAGCPDLE